MGAFHRCVRRSRTAVAPLERLKILMQVQGNEKIYTGVWQVRRGLAFGMTNRVGEGGRFPPRVREPAAARLRLRAAESAL